MKGNLIQKLLPVGLSGMRSAFRQREKNRKLDAYWAAKPIGEIRVIVQNAIENIARLSDSEIRDVQFLEGQLIPQLGLNNEHLQEQPSELSAHYGTGLHVWQYPNQLGAYLAWIAHNATEVKAYWEIGARWGGTFIVVSEFVRRVSGNTTSCVAIDPISPSPLISCYLEAGRCEYLQCFSTDPAFRRRLEEDRPDFVFIDGDHSLEGVMTDFEICSASADIIGFHDVCSDSCRETTRFWNFVRRHCAGTYDAHEFVGQYDSVVGNFMGIGVLRKKLPLPCASK
jgi:cephalosporin hydroxylase